MTKRTNYIRWNTYFMGIAQLSAMRSKDPNTQVGACIVDKKYRIISVGYNGFPWGCDDDEFPWSKDQKNPLDNKYLYVMHAEAGAIIFARKDLEGCSIYTTLFPCNECAKLIIQSGIQKVIYKNNKYQNTSSAIAAVKMFEAAEVETIQFDEKTNIEFVKEND